jgi:hypothetical protein
MKKIIYLSLFLNVFFSSLKALTPTEIFQDRISYNWLYYNEWLVYPPKNKRHCPTADVDVPPENSAHASFAQVKRLIANWLFEEKEFLNPKISIAKLFAEVPEWQLPEKFRKELITYLECRRERLQPVKGQFSAQAFFRETVDFEPSSGNTVEWYFFSPKSVPEVVPFEVIIEIVAFRLWKEKHPTFVDLKKPLHELFLDISVQQLPSKYHHKLITSLDKTRNSWIKGEKRRRRIYLVKQILEELKRENEGS